MEQVGEGFVLRGISDHDGAWWGGPFESGFVGAGEGISLKAKDRTRERGVSIRQGVLGIQIAVRHDQPVDPAAHQVAGLAIEAADDDGAFGIHIAVADQVGNAGLLHHSGRV